MIQRSVRLIGCFEVHWVLDDEKFKLPFGAIELFHDTYDLPGGKNKGTFWRWTEITSHEGLKSLSPPNNPPEAKDNAFIKNYDVVTKLRSLNSETLSFWICNPKKVADEADKYEGNILNFSGAIAFDQFDADKLKLRFPCLPTYENTTEDRLHCSRIMIGNGAEGFEFRVEVGLPLPAPFAINKDTTDGKGRSALGVGAIYASALRNADPVGYPFGILTGGSDETAYYKADNKVQIGDFGFSGDGVNPRENIKFARYGLGLDKDPSMAKGLGISAASLLAKLGFPGAKDNNNRKINNVEFDCKRSGQDNGIWTYSIICRRQIGPLKLDLSNQVGGILPIPNNIDVELGFQCSFSDEDIFRSQNKDNLPELICDAAVRLHWSDEKKLKSEHFFGVDLNPDPKVDDGDIQLEFGGIIEGARSMDAARLSLLPSKSQPQSFFPVLLGVPETGTKVRAQFVAYFSKIDASFKLGDGFDPTGIASQPIKLLFDGLSEIDWTSENRPSRPAQLGITLEPEVKKSDYEIFKKSDWKFESYTAKALQIKAYFNSINRTQPSFGNKHFHIQFTHDERAMAKADNGGVIYYDIHNSDKQNKPHSGEQDHWGQFRARLGSLDFTEHQQGKKLLQVGSKTDNNLTIRRRGRRRYDQRPVAFGQATLDVQLNLTLKIGDVIPVTVDRPHGDRQERRADLLIDENPNFLSRNSEARFLLGISERLRDDQDWHLIARLYERNPEANDKRKSFTVIGEEPFFVYRYSRLPLESSGNENDAQVAEWDSDQREWRYRKTSEIYRFTFPPAVTGESMDKPRRLEIHDPDIVVGDDKKITPIVELESDPKGTETYLVDSRLSPPTDIWTKPEDLARNYFLPEHSGRALFNQNGVFGPGMELAGLRGELLYAMPFGVKVPEPDTVAARPRIAEISALTGQMVMVEQLDKAEAKHTFTRWTALRDTMLSRPQRLETWSLDSRRADPFVPAKFEKGLNFSLRRTALLQPPVLMDSDENIAADTVEIAPPRLADHGLAGGALWPIESRNYIDALRAQPQSNGGSLEKFALSPHGGSGDQSAEFLNGNVKIISETRNGFVQKQRIEILGRIAAFWHRAKHVIVYERTTSPSAQFAPEENANSRSERPILRKVDEFIEIMEPVRRYPDYEGFNKKTSGFLEEVRFNSTLIRVNSAWGQDVGDIGWKVPLWNRGEAKIRPKVYPYPDLSFATLGEGADERPLAVQECLDADNVYFFADAESAKKTSDTDSWSSRESIDFTEIYDAGVVAEIIDKARPVGADNEDKERRPSASRLLPGMRRFTWRLAPATSRTQINAALGDKPIFSGLDTVTFMRSQGKPDDFNVSKLKPALNTRLTQMQSSTFSDVEDKAPWADNNPNSKPSGSKIDAYVSMQTGFADYVKNVEDYNDKDAKKKVKDVRDKLLELTDDNSNASEVLFKELDGHFGGGKLTAAVSTIVNDNKDLFQTLDDFDEKSCGRLSKRLSGQINSKKLLFIEHTKTAQRDLIALVNTADELLPDNGAVVLVRKEKIRSKIKSELTAKSNEIFDQARQDVGDVLENIEKARGIVGDWEEDSQHAIQKARSRVDAWYAAYDRDKPWSDNRIDRATQLLQSEIADVEDQAASALEELRLRLSSDIEGAAATLTTKISRMMAHSLKQAGNAKGQIGKIEGMLPRYVKPTTDFLGKVQETGKDSFDAKIKNIRKKLDDKLPSLGADARVIAELTIEALDKWPDVRQNAKIANEDIETLKKGAKSTLKEINDVIGFAKTETDKVFVSAKSTIEDVKTEANKLADLAGNEIEEELADLTSSLQTFVKQTTDVLKSVIDNLKYPKILEDLVDDTRDWLTEGVNVIENVGVEGLRVVDGWLLQRKKQFDLAADDVNTALKTAVEKQVIERATDLLLDPITDVEWQLDRKDLRLVLVARLDSLTDQVTQVIESGALTLADINKQIEMFCNELAGFKATIWSVAEDVKTRFKAEIKRRFAPHLEKMETFLGAAETNLGDLKSVLEDAKALDQSFKDLSNQVGEGAEYARAYVDRSIDLVGKLGAGGFKAGPNNALRLYSAVFQAPEIGTLRANMDRIRGTFQHAENIIKTSKAKAMFEKLGDALKAMGLDLPFSQLGDQFKLDTKDLKFEDIFGNFGGLDISQLVPNFGKADQLSEYINVTHDFDKKTARAWVKIDVAVPMNGRRKLFSIGPFTLYLRDSKLDGFVRMEASKDTEEVSSTDLAIIRTNIEAVVGGQVMVTLQDVQLVYTKDAGLDFVFDAKKIKLNPTFQFIQDTLGRLFGDELGGLKIVKQNGIPVGLEHVFKIPPISLMYGTSGVSNIQITNRFALLAYPDFVISNRFNLSKRELPFLFSIFIIGGTGYIVVETEYRPFDKELMVMVEAAAGGSASLGFAFGPVVGSVFISISVALRYQKRIGSGSNSGSGLTVSLVLVIAGNVSLWGMVHIYLGITLTMNYHESGQVDGIGALSVELRISRWFKFKYSTTVRYKLRNGQTSRQVSSSTEVGGEKFNEIKKKAEALKKARRSL